MSFQTSIDERRQVFLTLSSQIEGQLRELYDLRYSNGTVNQSSLAKMLGVHRSVVSRRLLGHTNMTVETIADMVWSLHGHVTINIAPIESSVSNITSQAVLTTNNIPEQITDQDKPIYPIKPDRIISHRAA
jgi:hypothetical protein